MSQSENIVIALLILLVIVVLYLKYQVSGFPKPTPNPIDPAVAQRFHDGPYWGYTPEYPGKAPLSGTSAGQPTTTPYSISHN